MFKVFSLDDKNKKEHGKDVGKVQIESASACGGMVKGLLSCKRSQVGIRVWTTRSQIIGSGEGRASKYCKI